MLNMSGKAKSYIPASGKLLPDLGARKVQVKLRDRSLRYVNPRVAYMHRALMAVSEMNDMGHDVFFPRSDRGIKAYAFHESSGTKLELERVYGVFELPVEIVPYSQSTSKNRTSGPYSSLSALEQIEDVGGSSGSRDVICPIPGGGLLEERPVVPGGRERTEREEHRQCRIEGDAAQGPVVKAKKAPSAPSLDEWDGHFGSRTC